MSRINSGMIVEITDGVHKGKTGFVYNREQVPEVWEKKKAVVWVIQQDPQTYLFDPPKQSPRETGRKVMIDRSLLKSIGMFD